MPVVDTALPRRLVLDSIAKGPQQGASDWLYLCHVEASLRKVLY